MPAKLPGVRALYQSEGVGDVPSIIHQRRWSLMAEADDQALGESEFRRTCEFVRRDPDAQLVWIGQLARANCVVIDVAIHAKSELIQYRRREYSGIRDIGISALEVEQGRIPRYVRAASWKRV